MPLPVSDYARPVWLYTWIYVNKSPYHNQRSHKSIDMHDKIIYKQFCKPKLQQSRSIVVRSFVNVSQQVIDNTLMLLSHNTHIFYNIIIPKAPDSRAIVSLWSIFDSFETHCIYYKLIQTMATVADLVKEPYKWSEDHEFESWMNLS